MALSRALAPEELVRRCGCGHMLVCKAGALCPRCRRVIPDVSAIHDAIATARRMDGQEGERRMAIVLGVEGVRFASDGQRTLEVVG